ncbi:vitamin D-binding protein [Microcaecilia unicolor]|uniref:Vitamin D-binding protein n=1 Tax=Microcaecilia unicolor TaxID=1415580 RepID=A0A6P7X7D4_9AMPH|nr:vitamin D-binding protein [Microcaecilia unicolor]
MKGVLILFLLIAIGDAEHRGRAYQRDKVCQEWNFLGKEKFSSLTIILNSRKYSGGSFEEVMNIVKEITTLVETCCAEGAAPDCYDNGATAISIKSCDPKTSYPKHPGIAACCIHTGLERKLCLAALQQPLKEFPTYVEPSNNELCSSFKRDPVGFTAKFLYEYSSNYAHAPLLQILNSTESYLKMIIACCTSKKSNHCFTEQRIQRKSVELLTVMTNQLCSHFAHYGNEKFKFRSLIMFGQKVPDAEFEDILPLVKSGAQMLTKCTSVTEDMQKEISAYTQNVCNTLSSKSQRVATCCKKTLGETLFCLHSMTSAEPLELPLPQIPNNEHLCNKAKHPEANRKYSYEIARRNTKLPEVFVDRLHEAAVQIATECCAGADSHTCLNNKKPQLRAEILKFLTEANELCEDYNKYVFTEFKKRLRHTLHKRMPKATSAKISELVQKQADLASTCCILNAPPVYCSEQITRAIGHMCGQETCLLH